MPISTEAVWYTISVVTLIWYLALWAIGLLGCYSTRRRYRSRSSVQLSTQDRRNTPGVSILRPLKGLDTNLYENLESTFKQDYPNYELIFSVADENDEALHIVDALVKRYPQVKTSIIVGEEVVGINPKVNNLIRPFRRAAHDILWVIDSGVMVDPGTLARSVGVLTGSLSKRHSNPVALVHHVPFAIVHESSIGTQIEAAFLNTNHAKMYIAINTVGIESCVVGKSNMYRRSDVERLNASMVPTRQQISQNHQSALYGLAAFGKYLAEDNMIASALWHELGLRHDLSCDVARNVIGDMSFMDYVWRRVRWIRVRKHMVLAATLLEPLTESLALLLIGSFAFGSLLNVSAWIFCPLHVILWLIVDLDVYASLAGHHLSKDSFPSFIAAYVAREVLAFPIWFIAVFGNEIIWRGQRYEVFQNGEARLASSGSSRLKTSSSTREYD